MFYFLLAPILVYNRILIIAAVVPAVFLMIRVYKADSLEKESPKMLFGLMIAGVLSTLLAMVEEYLGEAVLLIFFEENSLPYNILLYFGVVAIAEESSKYILLKKRSWYSREFNCQFDGVVYAVFVSLGFALWENISYVMHYGFSTALVRAVTAIPGHACFGVFMGTFYGLARGYAFLGKRRSAKLFRFLSVFVPALMHGTYDYIATSQNETNGWIFVLFIAAMFITCWFLVGVLSRNDKYFKSERGRFVDFEVLP